MMLFGAIPTFGWVPDVGWREELSHFFSQPPPWYTGTAMTIVLFLMLLLIAVQHRQHKALAKRRKVRRMAMYLKFKMRGKSREEYIKALAEDIITSGLEDAAFDGKITDDEKLQLYTVLAEGKPKLIGLKPRKADKLGWRARNELLAYLHKLRAARETEPVKALPLPDLTKIKVWGTGKMAATAHRHLKTT